MNEIEFLSLPPERQLKYIHGVLKQVGEDVRQTRNNFSAGDMESRVAFESAQDYMNKLYNSFYAAGLVTDQYGASAFVPARAPLDNTPPEFIM